MIIFFMPLYACMIFIVTYGLWLRFRLPAPVLCSFPAVAERLLTADIKGALKNAGEVAIQLRKIIKTYTDAPGIGPPVLEIETGANRTKDRLGLISQFGKWQLDESLVAKTTDWIATKTLAEAALDSVKKMTDDITTLNNSDNLKAGKFSCIYVFIFIIIDFMAFRGCASCGFIVSACAGISKMQAAKRRFKESEYWPFRRPIKFQIYDGSVTTAYVVKNTRKGARWVDLTFLDPAHALLEVADTALEFMEKCEAKERAKVTHIRSCLPILICIHDYNSMCALMQESQILVNAASVLFALQSRYETLEASDDPLILAQFKTHSREVFKYQILKKLHLKKASTQPKVLFIVMHSYERFTLCVLTGASLCDPHAGCLSQEVREGTPKLWTSIDAIHS